MALVGATSGLVLLAGTGAFVFGRSPTGEELLLDAIGPLYGDHGGAFQIGLAAVRASGRSDWHERFATSLGRVIPVACKDLAGEPNDFSMVHYMLEARDRSEIASLAKLVNCEAESGDRIAKAILVDAADDMIETVSCVVERLSLNGSTMPLIGSGGVAVHSDTYWNRVVERVSEFAPDLNPVRSIHQPALGLILAMAGELNLDSPSFREHLLGTQGLS
jgi:N-acetylglucosamine kinase-like BadF-type ATPase